MTALVERLSTLAGEAGCWSIAPDEVAALLGVDQVGFWRAVHEVRDRISFSDAIDGWSQDTVGELVTVVERIAGSGFEQAMTESGLFLPCTLGIELIEELLFRARRLAAAHEVRTEELGGMLRHTGSVRAAVAIYLDAYVDIEALIDGCAESFRTLRGLPALGRATAARYLRAMIARHALDRRSLVAGLEERLRLAAALLGFVDPEDRSRAGEAPDPGGRRVASRQAWARRALGVEGTSYTAETLRSRYRRLMMRYHPDANPSGLERCKDVNAAYALLMEAAGPGAAPAS